ncbi:MAG: hypothetical protein PF542_01340 [Nanoarchaeota archaeon]|jgi:hypothetical protein|nr:hypothetical protein [Nanoarchaeota archaeon]
MSIDDYEADVRKMPKQTAELITEFTVENKYVNYAIENAIYVPLKLTEAITRPGRSLAYQEVIANNSGPEMVVNFKTNKFETYIHTQKERMMNYFAQN